MPLAASRTREVTMAPARVLLLTAVSGCLLLCLSAARADEPVRSLKELQKARVAVLAERLAMAQKAAQLGVALPGEVDFWEYRLALARVEIGEQGEQLRKLLERRLAGIRAGEAAAEKGVNLGVGSAAEVLKYRAARLEVEVALARLKNE